MGYEPTWSLGWVDFSADDKSKVMQVLSMLGEKGTVDELGIGVVRDSLSDKMFNGTTTIQTRAKYFFIIPNILLSYPMKHRKGQSAWDFLHEEETRVMNELAALYDYSGENQIIGETIASENRNLPPNKWRQVVRKPSAIYWNGLRQFGFIQSDMSLANFLTLVEKESTRSNDGYLGDDGSNDDMDFDTELLKAIKLPSYSIDWEKKLCIQLSESEANFMRHQILDTQEGSLLALILSDLENTQKFLLCKSFEGVALLDFVRADEDVSKVVQTAKDFSFLMEGAHIRYNIQLQAKYGSEEKQMTFEDDWKGWSERLKQFKWHLFDRAYMWSLTHEHSNVKSFTTSFINSWLDGIQDGISEGILDELVRKQEIRNKGGRSKLRPNNDTRYGNWVGIRTLSYRFGNVKTIVSDIYNGLTSENA